MASPSPNPRASPAPRVAGWNGSKSASTSAGETIGPVLTTTSSTLFEQRVVGGDERDSRGEEDETVQQSEP